MTHFTKTNAPDHTDGERRIMNEAVETQFRAMGCTAEQFSLRNYGHYLLICNTVLRGMEKEAV